MRASLTTAGAFNNSAAGLAWAAERVVAAVADRGDAARCLELLLPDVFDATPPKTADAAFLEALDAAASRAPLCRLAGLCCARAPAQSVRNALPTLLPALGAACSAPGADVRKAAVDGLVDVYRALGDGVVPKFKRLPGRTAVHRAGLSAARTRCGVRGDGGVFVFTNLGKLQVRVGALGGPKKSIS